MAGPGLPLFVLFLGSVAGCVDNRLTSTKVTETCASDAAPVYTYAAPLATCATPPGVPLVEDPRSVRTLWQYPPDETATTSRVTPAVGYLVDDDGDGTFGPGDVPTVVATLGSSPDGEGARVVALRGDTGALRWSWGPALPDGSLALADADRDGEPEVLVVDPEGHVVSLDGVGQVRWRADAGCESARHFSLAIADLGTTGYPSIVADDLVLDGRDGSLQFRLSRASLAGAAAVADLDLDGCPEILVADGVFDCAGTFLWDSYFVEGGLAVAAVVQADSDPEAEVAWAEDRVGVWDTNGQRLSETVTIDGGRGVPCVGDFDGDGVAEVGWPTATVFSLVELDGRIVWQSPTDDESGLAGCSGFDLDGDGALEVLYGDETDFMILDGRTGARRYTDSARSSLTVLEYPVPVDVDGDGHAEILVVSEGGAPALQVYTHAGAGWSPAGPGWTNHAYSLTNVSPSGVVPHLPVPSWLANNTFRARPAADPILLADLLVRVEWPCPETAPDRLDLVVTNQGSADVAAGATVTLTQAGAVVATVVLPVLPAGATVSGLGVEGVDPDEAFSVSVDPDDQVAECDEGNNGHSVEPGR